MRNEFEWVKELKSGDKVAVEKHSTWHGKRYSICKVEKITPTGRINLSDGTRWYPDGRNIGSSHRCLLRKITPEILEIIERNILINNLEFDDFVYKLSTERLKMLMEWKIELLGDDQ